jgi:hypothetical protein
VHRTIALGLGLLLGVALWASCGNKPPCTSTCNGCCDPMGVCQSGATSAQCGRDGFTCQACIGAQVCIGGFCTALGGPGGGSGAGGGSATGGGASTGGGAASGGGAATGGGSGTGGGGTNCASFPTFNAVRAQGTVAGSIQIVAAFDAFGAPYDELGVVVQGQNGGAVPGTQDLSQKIGTSACAYCLEFGQGCDGGGCAKTYVATAGTLTISELNASTDGGSLVSSFSNVVFTEWNFQTNAAAVPVSCLRETGDQPFDVSWGAP